LYITIVILKSMSMPFKNLSQIA